MPTPPREATLFPPPSPPPPHLILRSGVDRGGGRTQEVNTRSPPSRKEQLLPKGRGKEERASAFCPCLYIYRAHMLKTLHSEYRQPLTHPSPRHCAPPRAQMHQTQWPLQPVAQDLSGRGKAREGGAALSAHSPSRVPALDLTQRGQRGLGPPNLVHVRATTHHHLIPANLLWAQLCPEA